MSKMKLDQDLIRTLASLMEETGLTEIEISNDDDTIRVAKGHTTTVQAAAPAPVIAASPSPSVAGDEDLSNHPGVVTSPMVGTVYMAPEPGAPMFIRVGDKVTEGQTILIIEAMKTMNAVAATCSGTITQIVIDNEQPVEYGQPLAIIE